MTGGSAWQGLRAATAQAHAALEAAPLNRRLFADDFTSGELACLLNCMVTVYRPLEMLVIPSDPARSLGYRPRLPLLVRALTSLGAEISTVGMPPPPLADDMACLGALYVVEGSTLGGQMIYRQLSGRFAPDALAVFMPHGDRVGENWSRFRAELDARLNGPGAMERAAAGANATFCMFRQALSAN